MRWANYGKLDTQLAEDGDSQFIGLDMRRDRDKLPPGFLARSENKRLANFGAATRGGFGLAADFNAAFEDVMVGSGVFNNPNGDRVLLVATRNASYVWVFESGKLPVQIQLEAGQGTTGGYRVEFVQAFDHVFMLRNPIGSLHTLAWDGTNSGTFSHVTLSATGISLIPVTTDGEAYQDRLLLYDSQATSLPWRNQFVMTDVEDYSSYDPANSVFRVNAGQSEQVIRIWPFRGNSVIVFMRHSLYQVANFTIDPTQTTQTLLNGLIGCAAKKCVLQVGSDLIFASRPGGFYRLSESLRLDPSLASSPATEAVPISDPIQPIIDRIVDWDSFGIYACSALLGDYAYFAFPIDVIGAGGCNVLAVLNTATNYQSPVTGQIESGVWESIDTWDSTVCQIHALHVIDYQGSDQVLALDYINMVIYVLGQTTVDSFQNVNHAINDVIETRGYTLNDPSVFKLFTSVRMSISTSNPLIQVSAISDGVNEVQPLYQEPLTKDNLKFYPHGYPAFNPATDDPLEPKREDYSNRTDEFDISDFTEFQAGPLPYIPATLVIDDTPEQQSLESFSIRQRGRWCSLRIENSNGTCNILGTSVSGRGVSDALRVKA